MKRIKELWYCLAYLSVGRIYNALDLAVFGLVYKFNVRYFIVIPLWIVWCVISNKLTKWYENSRNKGVSGGTGNSEFQRAYDEAMKGIHE